MSFVALGWQVTALVVGALLVHAALRFISAWEDGRARTKEVIRLETEIDHLRLTLFTNIERNQNEAKAWLDQQRSAHAKILEDHLGRIKTLETLPLETSRAISTLEARVVSLEQINEVSKRNPTTAPGDIGPFLRNRKAGTT